VIKHTKFRRIAFSLSKNKTLPPLSDSTSRTTFLLPPQIQILCSKDVETVVGGVMMVLDHPHHLCGQFSPTTRPLCVVVSGGSRTFLFFSVLVWVDIEVAVFVLFRRWFGGGARSGGVWFLACCTFRWLW
jgi:hypothetical protein